MTTTTTILKRTPTTPRRRPVAFYDGRQGALTREDGKSITIGTRGGASAILRALAANPGAAEVVYLVMGDTAGDAPPPEWYKRPAGEGWRVEYRHDATPARRSATYTREGAGPAVQFRHSSAWFGAERSIPAMRSALRTLESRLTALFGNGVLLGSPAQSGLALLERALPFGGEYPTPPAELAALIHAHSPQARKQVFSLEPTARLSNAPGFFYYDARLAYAAPILAGAKVPAGEITHTRAHGFEGIAVDPYRRALYRCEWQAPAWWSHVGILPERPGVPGAAWNWPAHDGGWHEGWAWAPLVDLARRERWNVRILEAYEWRERTGKNGGGDPLRTWAKHLVTIYLEGVAGRYGPQVSPLVQSAARAILLTTIGSFHRRETVETRVYPLDTPLNLPMTLERELTPHGWEVRVPHALDAARSRYSQPHWSAWLWAAWTARLTSSMLALWPGDLLGCNTDAFCTAAEYPTEGEPRVGQFRLKGVIRHAVERPRTLAALSRLAAQSAAALALEGNGTVIA